MVTERHERGQLILITAIAIAFILLAIVIVFNGLLFTQTIASEDASKATGDVISTEQELEEGIHGVVLRSNLNANTSWDDEVELFVSEYRNITGTSRPAVVNVSVDEDSAIPGTLVTPANRTVEEEHQPLVNESDGNYTIGYFSLEIIDPDVDDEDEETEISFADSEGNITITIGESEGCEVGENDRFDFVQGTTTVNIEANEDCSFPPIEGEYKQITIDNGTTSPRINYNVVVEGSPPVGNNSATEEAAWGISGLEYTYDSSDVTATRTIDIENIYGEEEDEVPDHLWPWGAPP